MITKLKVLWAEKLNLENKPKIKCTRHNFIQQHNRNSIKNIFFL